MTDSSTSTTGVIVPGTYRLDPSKSRVRYSGKHMFGMGTVHATFTVQGGELRVCEPLATSSVIVTVDAASFSSNSARRDKDVRSASLLDVARYPAITFASESLHQNGDTLLVTGTVTAHGHTVGVDVLIDHLTHEGTGIRLHGRAEHLDRTAFGITGSRGMVGRYLRPRPRRVRKPRPETTRGDPSGRRDSHPRTSRSPNQPKRRNAMAIAVHLVNTPKNDAREAYETAWRRIDEQGVRHPKGRQSHTAWVVDDVLHVVDVWDSEDDLQQWMQTLAPILQDSNMELAGEPEAGELLQIVRPD